MPDKTDDPAERAHVAAERAREAAERAARAQAEADAAAQAQAEADLALAEQRVLEKQARERVERYIPSDAQLFRCVPCGIAVFDVDTHDTLVHGEPKDWRTATDPRERAFLRRQQATSRTRGVKGQHAVDLGG